MRKQIFRSPLATPAAVPKACAINILEQGGTKLPPLLSFRNTERPVAPVQLGEAWREVAEVSFRTRKRMAWIATAKFALETVHREKRVQNGFELHQVAGHFILAALVELAGERVPLRQLLADIPRPGANDLLAAGGRRLELVLRVLEHLGLQGIQLLQRHRDDD